MIIDWFSPFDDFTESVLPGGDRVVIWVFPTTGVSPIPPAPKKNRGKQWFLNQLIIKSRSEEIA
jgi:hypothetical protein